MTKQEQAPAQFRGGDADKRTEFRLSRDASFHQVGRRGVVFDAARQQLYMLNSGAGFVWCCLAEGYSCHDVVRAYAMHAGIPVDQAARILCATLSTWRSLGLLATKESSSPVPHNREPMVARKSPTSVPAAPTPASGESISISILDTMFDVVCDIDVSDRQVALVLGGLAVAQAVPDVRRAVEHVAIIPNGDQDVEICHAGRSLWTGPSSQAVCATFAMLVRVALEKSKSYPAIHAGAIADGKGVVLFPGPSGCGKTTLMAALLAAGVDVLCDDTVVLGRNSMRVRPVVPDLCLKSGCWPSVGHRFAEWSEYPVLIRPDGMRVRYIAAHTQPAIPGAVTHGHSVRALVFPRYRPGADTKLIRISVSAALHRLVRCIDPLGHAISADDIQRLIRWAGTLDCYSLVHDSLDESVAALHGILT